MKLVVAVQPKVGSLKVWDARFGVGRAVITLDPAGSLLYRLRLCNHWLVHSTFCWRCGFVVFSTYRVICRTCSLRHELYCVHVIDALKDPERHILAGHTVASFYQSSFNATPYRESR